MYDRELGNNYDMVPIVSSFMLCEDYLIIEPYLNVKKNVF